VECIPVTQRHMPNDIDTLSGFLSSVEFFNKPIDLTARIAQHLPLEKPEVPTVKQICVERDNAQVTMGIFG
jgi:hypothetical protein